jgi:hypothetical protein
MVFRRRLGGLFRRPGAVVGRRRVRKEGWRDRHRHCRSAVLHSGQQGVGEAVIAATGGLPAQIRRSLTWDCGTAMARHTAITATGLPVFFAHPHSPWERGSNENLNRIVREFFPKGVDITFDPNYFGGGGLRNQRPTPQNSQLEEAIRAIHRTCRGECFHRLNLPHAAGHAWSQAPRPKERGRPGDLVWEESSPGTRRPD